MQTGILIDGNWRSGENRERMAVLDPSTGDTIVEIDVGTPADAVIACDAAAAAQPGWAATPPRVRSEILRTCYLSLTEHCDEIAELITRENGKPLADAVGEVVYAAEFFRWNAEQAVRIHGTIGMAPAGDKRIITRHVPVGVVVMVTPWNFPAAMIARKVAPALAAGNTVVVKPASETPLTALRVAELIEDAGTPPGVVNVVPTRSADDWFKAAVDHRAVRMVSFTGSTEVGRLLLRRCADRVLKTGMELGGNAPFIVFADADVEAAVEGAMVAKMRHSAETCTAANRFFVESHVHDEFVERFAAAMGSLKVGNGFEPGVDCGPMINAGAVADIDSLVKAAMHNGARRVTGGGPIDRPGFFYEPTVLVDVNASSSITRSEIFGPVAPVISFDDTEAMIAAANDTEMGLIGYVFTQDLAKGLRVSERIEAGMVAINRGAISDPAAPFGGMKQSGLGREGASEGIYEFCETQYIGVNW